MQCCPSAAALNHLPSRGWTSHLTWCKKQCKWVQHRHTEPSSQAQWWQRVSSDQWVLGLSQCAKTGKQINKHLQPFTHCWRLSCTVRRGADVRTFCSMKKKKKKAGRSRRWRDGSSNPACAESQLVRGPSKSMLKKYETVWNTQRAAPAAARAAAAEAAVSAAAPPAASPSLRCLPLRSRSSAG